jgi:hypothetical protein
LVRYLTKIICDIKMPALLLPNHSRRSVTQQR